MIGVSVCVTVSLICVLLLTSFLYVENVVDVPWGGEQGREGGKVCRKEPDLVPLLRCRPAGRSVTS